MNNNNQYNEAKNFLGILSQNNPDEIFHFQTFDDHRDSRRTNLNRILVGTLDQHFDELMRLNNSGAGVFVTVNKIENSQRRETKSVSKIRAVFADKDDGNFDQFPIKPTMIVQTKNGQHAYWITDEVSRDSFTELQKSIINTLKTDISIHDLPRVMRLPGFYHRKNPNDIFLVTVVVQSTNKYSLDDLVNAFPKPEIKKTSLSSTKGTHTEISKFIEKLDGAVQGEGGDLKTFQVACYLVRGFNLSNDEALKYFNKYNEKCLPPWSESDLVKKLESARKSGSGEFGSLIKATTTEQWVHKFLEKNKVKTSYNQKIIFDDEVITAASLVRKAEIQWDNEGYKSKSGLIKNILEEWEHDSRKKILVRVRETIKFSKNLKYHKDQDPLTCFTKALVGDYCEELYKHRAVIGHFIWQVKRKIFGYGVVHHMCPVLVGKQGSGKTQALENLIAPLKTLSMEGNLGTFVRENEKFVFGTYYIIKLDEFGKGEKADLESMKHIMSSTDINYRTFYVQKMANMPNVATFIGASNRSVADIFNDQTGNRRFYEIPCLDRVNWEEIGGYIEDGGIDYHSLWKSVNENDESPIIPYIPEIQKYQEEFRAKSLVEEWLASEDLIPLSTDTAVLKSVKVLHPDFMDWLKRQNANFMFTIPRFGKELAKYLKNKKKNDGSYYFIKALPKEHPLLMNINVTQSFSNKNSADDEIEDFITAAMETKVDLNRVRKS